MNFMNSFEARLIRRDAKEMILCSSESATIEIHYQYLSGTQVYDPVYDSYSGQALVSEVLTGVKAIQKIVKPKEDAILDWGILETGDCIFYLDAGVDLENLGGGAEVEITKVNVENESMEWKPVLRHENKPFYESIVLRVGNNVLFQPIPAKLIR